MGYCTIEEIIAEGVDSTSVGETRLEMLIELAGKYIDKVTGQWFEERRDTVTLDGRGVESIFFPAPIIELVRVVIDDTTAADLEADYFPDRFYADGHRLVRRIGVFSPGKGNVEVTADFGYLEDGETPKLINHVCKLLVIRSVYPAASEEARDAKKAGAIISEKIRDYSYTLSELAMSGGPTGDPEIDMILENYRKPAAIGAV